ncbi:hypothetical protein [Catellatospora chokoriensis]|uniref:hypothetical protein n=1 Tax=Catellatospora chokoriensis TaxID=310353 RepID=UPI00177CBD30|nr:hypothetical protein [Catellatospora chokoriensis]
MAPADPNGWEPGAGTVDGWSAFITRSADPLHPAAPWATVPGPMLTASVLDSDVALLIGWDKGEERFRWLFNEAAGADYGVPGSRAEEPDEQTQAAERVPVVAAMLAWAAEAGLTGAEPDRLDDILSRGYVLAEDGLFATLAALGVIPPGGYLYQAEQAEQTGDILERPEFQHLALARSAAGGTTPEQPAPMFLATAIDHDGPAWARFVVRHELEEWGRPGCLVAAWQEFTAGATTFGSWTFYLTGDPALVLYGWHGTLEAASGLPGHGPWLAVPGECTDIDSAVAWARAQVAADATPAAAPPHRGLVETELAEQLLGMDMTAASPHARAAEPRLVCQLFTYTDLAEHIDTLADWLADARRLLIDPVLAAYGPDRIWLAATGDGAPPYGVSASIDAKSVKGRWSHNGAGAAQWNRALNRLRSGQLHSLGLRLDRLNGEGSRSSHHRGIGVHVELRDQFTEATGPLPDGHPATIVISAARSLLDEHVPGGTAAVVDLLQRAALRFGAVTGYVHGSGSADSLQSPFERRGTAHWRKQRLDTMSRGVHWGNLIGAGHLAAIGGLDRLERLLTDGRVRRLEQWSTEPQLWWFELTDDPFGPVNAHADTVAPDLREIIAYG